MLAGTTTAAGTMMVVLGAITALITTLTCEDITWADGIAGDVPLGHLQCHRLGESSDAMLGCVVRRLVGRCHEGVHAASVDDAAPALLQHVGQGCLGSVEGGVEAHSDDVVPLVLGEVLHRADILDACSSHTQQCLSCCSSSVTRQTWFDS